MSTLLLICFIAGATGSLLQGMLGVGTGIIIVPLQLIPLQPYSVITVVKTSNGHWLKTLTVLNPSFPKIAAGGFGIGFIASLVGSGE